MENFKFIKYTLLIIVFIWIIISCSHAQVTYQKYDNVTKGVEYHILKSQINSNIKTIELLKESKKNHSIFNKSDSITRSRIQNVVSAKQNENFRLNQKAFLVMNANKIDDVGAYNQRVSNFRRQMVDGK